MNNNNKKVTKIFKHEFWWLIVSEHRAFAGVWLIYLCYYFKENWFSFFQQLSFKNSFLIRGRTLFPPPLFCLDLSLHRTCQRPGEFIWVSSFLCMENKIIYHQWLLHFFIPSLLYRCLSLEELYEKGHHFQGISYHIFQWWEFVLVTVYGK